MEQTGTELRPLLLSIAYRMLGSFGDAEDVVQEAYLRLHREPEQVRSVKAYLTTVTTRLAIDQLRSARRQREQYVGPWLPEPAVDGYVDLAERAALSDSLATAFLVVLERLSPEQRAVFLLRDVFGYGYQEVAGIVGKTQAAVRQTAVRARRELARERPRFDSSRQERDELVRRFVAASEHGELDGLLELLAPAATFTGDGGGKALSMPEPVLGAEQVARLVVMAFERVRTLGFEVRFAQVGGQPALRITGPGDATAAVWSLQIAGGRVAAIHSVVNPDKLGHLQTAPTPPAQPLSPVRQPGARPGGAAVRGPGPPGLRGRPRR
ncbi:RNA polymerase, sigma-24 subunit, ECF subfamily [Kribbella flavida DSM 17836]|uniref:RNA polymerase, sigma-24 subunit, ECF subfamily n=1 Tax=Kribbella flavida (strain DSM 17836 / JCM 10339 / NBRC 14399) TaxID=479435 RepID=D2PZ44_KRIFD|nr:RNA polymerase sigma-70 factor [Kribbella flavida]ADB31838.1 RNA polymerase, sigma-24 subunit, ECF subfamily [Kribbella flavida DSM 17836]